MSASEPNDILIVGAGPVGLTSAIQLARTGLRVTVVEKWPTRYAMPRACTIDHEALRILQSAGVMKEYSHLFEPSRGERGGYQIRNADGVLLHAINWNRPAESGWPNTNGFYQPDLESALETIALSLPTITMRRGWTAEALTQSDDSVTLTVLRTGTSTPAKEMPGDVTEPENIEREELHGRWLIAADGANSVIRDLLGIESVDAGFEADWLVVDYRPLIETQWDAFVTQYCDPAQPTTAVNSGPGRRRFEFMRRNDVSRDELSRSETAWKLMAPWNVTPETAELERHAVYTFRGRWADEWRRGRVFLAGDAAHLMPPFLGQGLCSGLRDASALAWRLSLVEAGLAGESVLDSYAAERVAHVREIIDVAVSIGQVICELDPVKAAVRDARMIAELASSITVEPPQPRLGRPSITDIGDPNAGLLSVQGRVKVDAAIGLFDDVIGGTWQLIGLGAGSLAGVSPPLREWFERIGGTITEIEPAADVDGSYGDWFEAHGCCVVLSRPDFYVYGSGASADAPLLVRSLRDALTKENTMEGALS